MDLKPCPFCNIEPVGKDYFRDTCHYYFIMCPVCHKESVHTDTPHEALEHWNMRVKEVLYQRAAKNIKILDL